MKYLDYPEQQKHKGQEFPFFFYHVTWLHPRYTMPYHWHPLWEIVHVFAGNFLLHLDNEDILLHAGDSALISPGVIHGGHPMEPKDCCYECLLMDTERIFQSSRVKNYEQETANILNQKVSVTPCFPASMEEFQSVILKMLDCARYRQDGYTLILWGLTYVFFGRILEKHCYTQNSRPDKSSRKTAQFKKIMEYIDNHYQEPVTLDDMAAAVGMTPNYFCRYFKEMTHRTPMDYLNYYRIEAACERLSYTDKSISEIAYECGFQDAGYFVKVFRRYKQITPSQYIKSIFDS